MQHDNERSASSAVVSDCSIDTDRRRALSFLGCLPAVMAPGKARASVSANFDDTIFFLGSRLAAAAAALTVVEPREQPAKLREIIACVQAMTVIPASTQGAIDAKIQAAQWSVDLGSHSMRLASEHAKELMASANEDRDRALNVRLD